MILAASVLACNSREWTEDLIDEVFRRSQDCLKETLDNEKFVLLPDNIVGDDGDRVGVEIVENLVINQQLNEVTVENFFQNHEIGIMEIRNVFHPMWREGDFYQMMDPLACGEDGQRCGRGKAAACVFPKLTIEELVKVVLRNNGVEPGEPFAIHGLKVERKLEDYGEKKSESEWKLRREELGLRRGTQKNLDEKTQFPEARFDETRFFQEDESSERFSRLKSIWLGLG